MREMFCCKLLPAAGSLTGANQTETALNTVSRFKNPSIYTSTCSQVLKVHTHDWARVIKACQLLGETSNLVLASPGSPTLKVTDSQYPTLATSFKFFF